MALLRIVYTSQQVGELDLAEIERLAKRAAAWNSQRGLTGFLAHAASRFLQALEGERALVNRVYHDRIVTDRRHEHLRLIAVENVSSRIFVDSAMGFENVTRDHHRLLSTFFPHAELEPDLATPAGCLEFLRCLSRIPHTESLRLAI